MYKTRTLHDHFFFFFFFRQRPKTCLLHISNPGKGRSGSADGLSTHVLSPYAHSTNGLRINELRTK